MRITESQLRRIIRQEVARLNESLSALTPGPIDTAEHFDLLKPGDRIVVDGRPAVFEKYEDIIATMYYTLEGSSVRRDIDARYAWIQEPGELPEIPVEWVGPGEPVKARRAPRRRPTPNYYD